MFTDSLLHYSENLQSTKILIDMGNFIRFILVMISLAISEIAFASDAADIKDTDVFEIYFVNAPKGEIYINNQPLHVNSTFAANAVINWKNPFEYIRAKNLRTKKKYKICHADYKKINSKSLSDYIRKKYTGDKSESDYLSEGNYLSQNFWYMVDDEVEIPIHLPLGDGTSCIFKFFSIPDNKEIWAINDIEDHTIVLTREQLEEKDIDVNNLSDYSFKVQYEADGQDHALTLNFQIIYIPNHKY